MMALTWTPRMPGCSRENSPISSTSPVHGEFFHSAPRTQSHPGAALGALFLAGLMVAACGRDALERR